LQAKGTNKKEKGGLSLVDLAYRRAKAVKAVKKAVDSGKIVKKSQKKSSNVPRKTPSRTEEMRDLFQTDMKDKKPKRRGVGGGKKAKSSFKSKSRYENCLISETRNSELLTSIKSLISLIRDSFYLLLKLDCSLFSFSFSLVHYFCSD